MTPKAVIFDIYNTLLEVGPPPADAEVRWERLCHQLTPATAVSLEEFKAATTRRIVEVNTAAVARGIAFPEVYWPDIAKSVLPQLGSLSPMALDDFLHAHAQLQRGTRLSLEAAAVVSHLLRRQILLGLCSNCQPYTLRELADALAPHHLSLEIFHPRVRFLSFQAGFSKPNPAAFQQVQRALDELHISAPEVLFVGDRLDNDIFPAEVMGWQTWRITAASGWKELAQQRLDSYS